MKKTTNVLAMAVFLVAVTSTAFATTFSDGGVKIWGESSNGRIHVTGSQEDVEKYVRNIQFCPDQIKYKPGFVCGLNWPVTVERISSTEAVFQLDADGMKNGQRAFNFKSDGHWSQVSTSKTNGNIVVEMSDPNADSEDGRGGCHYTYVGDLPAGSYTPYRPEACGGIAGGKVAKVKTSATAGGNNGSDQGAVAVATDQAAAAAHNSAAGTTGAIVANSSSQAAGANMFNITQVNTVKGKGKNKGGNTSIIYAPNAKQEVRNNIIRGNSADVKVYNNKAGKGKGSGIKNVITYVGPSYQTIHFGVSGAETYDAYACTKCHSPSASDDEKARKLVLKQMSSALVDKHAADEYRKHPAKKGKK